MAFKWVQNFHADLSSCPWIMSTEGMAGIKRRREQLLSTTVAGPPLINGKVSEEFVQRGWIGLYRNDDNPTVESGTGSLST